MEEYLTTIELSERIKFSKQTLYNLICKKTFVVGKHYLKPTPKKILFKWSEIQNWMGDPTCFHDENKTESYSDTNSDLKKPDSLINI